MEPYKTIDKIYPVPMDVLMDILKIAMRYEIPNRVDGINEKENIIMLRVKFPAGHPYRREIKENIENILSEYGIFANGSPEDIGFGEIEQDDF